MKKQQIIAVLVLVTVNIWMRFYAPIYKVALILKHISSFLLIGIFAYNVLTFILKRIVKKYNPKGKKEIILYVGRSVIFGVVIVLVAMLQFDYIEYSETPFTEHCRYYDNYNHLVYETMIYESCPELDVVESSKYVLEFNVTEATDVYQVADLAPGVQTLSKRDQYNATMYSTIRIDYDRDYRMANISQKMTMISRTIDRDGNWDTYYYSYHKLVNNDYTTLYDATYKVAETLSHYEGIVDIYTGHNIFDESDYNTTRYYADNYIIDDSNGTGEGWQVFWEYDLVKEYTEDDSLQIETLAFVSIEHENNKWDTYIERTNWNQDGDTDMVHLEFGDLELNEYVDRESATGNIINWNLKYDIERPHLIVGRMSNINNNTFLSKDVDYKSYQIRNTNYLFKDSYNIYGVTKTEYGYHVSYERYRLDNYLIYLYTRQFTSDMIYYEDGRYAYGLRYQILFDVDYSLDWLANSNDVMYTFPTYIN